MPLSPNLPQSLEELAVYRRVSERALASDIFITPSGIADIDRMLTEERDRRPGLRRRGGNGAGAIRGRNAVTGDLHHGERQ